ncbi:hypothetical protein [Nocardia jiangxiensis]|uniref:Secreted protein n=1 Tax=Nocardia jiangxiensis TaxID=282685 RepID=A0ABW6RTK7_9NOCA|nr:hypothetical protein [Nocardia jiangxiensis]
MRIRATLAGVVVLAGFAAVAVTAPAAGARPIAQQRYTCTGTDWSGKPLQPLTFQIKGNRYQAAHRAQTTWRGVAKFSSIVCQSS